MILSTKGRYAVMAMVELARECRKGTKTTALANIAEQQEIPQAYLEQIFSRLRQEGLIQAIRGPRGGYQLARSPDDISIAAIILAADETIEMTRCGLANKDGCMKRDARCLTHDLWEGLTNHIHDYLNSISLADVCRGELPIIAARGNQPIFEEQTTWT